MGLMEGNDVGHLVQEMTCQDVPDRGVPAIRTSTPLIFPPEILAQKLV